ncbi:MAG TPA: hypothetical protein VNI02_15995 [Blastocatellia bacterium]|nr:hypothetical protein [Blastocatellia bacterium]
MIFDLIRAAQTRHIISLVACVVWLGIEPQPCAAKSRPALFGEYIGMGCPAKGKTAPCIPTKATDRVRISRGKDANATVNIKIVFAEGHTCTLEGRASWSDGRFTLRADGLDPNKPCQLVLRIRGSVLTLEDPGGLCREVYCGARGAFDGARFKKRR